MQAVCQPAKSFKLWGFFRSTAADARFQAIFFAPIRRIVRHRGATMPPAMLGVEPARFITSSLGSSALSALGFC